MLYSFFPLCTHYTERIWERDVVGKKKKFFFFFCSNMWWSLDIYYKIYIKEKWWWRRYGNWASGKLKKRRGGWERGRKVFHHVCEVEQHLIGDTRLLPIFSFSFWGSRVSRREGAGNSKRPSGVSSLDPPTSHFFPPAISIFISFFFFW